MSQKIEATINKTEVTLYTVERGERAKQVRLDNGIEISANITIHDINEDFNDDFPMTAKTLKDAGINLSSLVAVIEVRK